MIKLVIHVADIHMRNIQRSEEYSEQLNKFIQKCNELTEGYERNEVRILIAGDLYHSKNTITPELITFASSFLRKLELIAPVIVYSGNHDLVLSNLDRKDALSALFQTANFTSCKLLDMVCGYESKCIHDDNVTWALYSIFDDYNRPNIEKAKEDWPNDTVIGLYHGTVVGCSLPNGNIMDDGLSGDKFEGCDIVMAGHIHKHQELRRGNTVIIYPSSLIQQDYGETVTQHGFMVYDLEKNKRKFIELENDYAQFDVEINSIDDIDKNEEIIINY